MKNTIMTIAFNFLPLPTSEMIKSISELTGTCEAESTAGDGQ
jgi:hypothetical protein